MRIAYCAYPLLLQCGATSILDSENSSLLGLSNPQTNQHILSNRKEQELQNKEEEVSTNTPQEVFTSPCPPSLPTGKKPTTKSKEQVQCRLQARDSIGSTARVNPIR